MPDVEKGIAGEPDVIETSWKVVVVGGGRTGGAILEKLAKDPRFDPFVLDVDYGRLSELRAAGIQGAEVSGNDIPAMAPFLKDAACVVCAAPSSVAPTVARAASAAGCHYLDLCEVSPVTPERMGADLRPGQCFVPSCGLAPGFVSVLVDEFIRGGDSNADITVYTGVLPAERTNRLGYGNLWGLDGLIAEYTSDCISLKTGKMVTGRPLRDVENLAIDGITYEAFSTSGSLDNLVRTYSGRLSGLRFKTLRYPGHLDHILFLLEDLNLKERLYLFRNLLLNGLDLVERDTVLIHIVDHNPRTPRSLTHVYHATAHADGHFSSAVATVSASHVCAVVELLVRGLVPAEGVLHNCFIDLDHLMQSRHGATLLQGGPLNTEAVGKTQDGGTE